MGFHGIGQRRIALASFSTIADTLLVIFRERKRNAINQICDGALTCENTVSIRW